MEALDARQPAHADRERSRWAGCVLHQAVSADGILCAGSRRRGLGLQRSNLPL